MLPLFIGLTIANLLLLGVVFALGLLLGYGHAPTWYSYHVLFAIFAGLMVVFVHLIVYTYFMATTKWLGAAVDKANLPVDQYVTPSAQRKRRAFAVVMTAIVVTMLTMFSGAAADTVRHWPPMIHLISGIATLVANGLCALAEYKLISEQGRLMDSALAELNTNPNLIIKHA